MKVISNDGMKRDSYIKSRKPFIYLACGQTLCSICHLPITSPMVSFYLLPPDCCLNCHNAAESSTQLTLGSMTWVGAALFDSPNLKGQSRCAPMPPLASITPGSPSKAFHGGQVKCKPFIIMLISSCKSRQHRVSNMLRGALR